MIDFIGKRKYAFILSLVFLAAGIVSFIVNGFVMDIDFMGGTIIEMDIGRDFDSNELESVVQSAINKKAVVQKMGTTKQQATIKTEPLTQEERELALQAVQSHYNLGEESRLRTSDVQAIMGEELRRKGITAAVVASLLILGYTAFQFRRVSGFVAGTAAIIALLHDIFIMLFAYSLLRIPLNSSFIAATLTVLGYSINNTIVIYDRIRENQGLHKKKDFAEIVNISINQSLRRTIYTTITTVIAVLCVYVAGVQYGVESIKEFSFPILIGLASGTYTSIFIASQLWVAWKELEGKNKVVKKSAKAKA